MKSLSGLKEKLEETNFRSRFFTNFYGKLQ